MTGEELQRFRERRGLERQEFAELLNSSLGTNHNGDAISRWERGAGQGRPVPKKVAAFLERLALEEFAGGGELGGEDGARGLEDDDRPIVDDELGRDSAPGPGAVDPQPALGGGGAYARACEELWELVATGIGLAGGALRSQALIYDSQIILADKEALGAAWGKLAQTNKTFQKMLLSMTEGGAWMQVALVTGTTFTKCWQAHQHVANERRAQALEVPVVDDDAAAAAA